MAGWLDGWSDGVMEDWVYEIKNQISKSKMTNQISKCLSNFALNKT